MANEKPLLNELAKVDDDLAKYSTYLNSLVENEDSVLRDRGGDLKIYDELLRDDQVESTFEQRRNAITGAELEIKPASEAANDVAAAEFIKENLANINFDDKCDKMLFGRFYGWAVSECMWESREGKIYLKDIKVRDRGRFKFNKDNELYLIDGISNINGKKMPDRKFWYFSTGGSHDDNPYGLGLAHSIYWPVFFKRNGIKFWLIFLEKFGMPTIMAKLGAGNFQDQKKREEAISAIRAVQSNSGAVIPDDVAIELLEAARSGKADYSVICERMDKAISKVIVGQTMTTDDGSSMAQANVHADVADALKKSDADLLCGSFNQSVVKWLIDWNFPPGTGYPQVWRKVEPPEDLDAIAERDTKISALGFEPTEEYIEETYGPGWKKKEVEAVPQFGPVDGPEFAELSKLAQKRITHRQDQDELVEAAEALAANYKNVFGDRVEKLLQYAEDADDFEFFRKGLIELMEEAPSPKAVEAIERATFFSRLKGLFQGQR